MTGTISTDTAQSLLFKHFATLSSAPDGIARLRELILQLAVQGKLGTQDPGDEPASVLFERIRKEKERLVKEGQIPKQNPSDPIESNFFIPILQNNWILARLGDISNRIHYGYTASSDETNKKVRLIRITDIQNNQVVWENVPGCEIHDSVYSSYAIKPGDLLVARTGGTIGKSYLVRDVPVPAVFASYLIRIVPNKNLDSNYIKLFADSPIYWNQLYSKCMGTGQPNVNGTSLRSLIISLPPLAEQHRIVAKVDRLMALCDQLEALQRQEKKGSVKLATASLTSLQNAGSQVEFERYWTQVCEAFELILDCQENVGMLRQTILQLAVQGKLGTQDPGDEPASVLVERIRKEKERLVEEGRIKQKKTQNLVKSSDNFFILPSGWIFINLHELGVFTGGMTPSTMNLEYWNGTTPWVSSKDVKTKYIFDSELKISKKALDNNRLSIIPKESIVIVARSGILKRTLPVSITKIECTVNQDIKVIIPYLPMITEYLHLLLKGYEKFILKELVKGGMTVQSLKYEEFEYQLFPLPPLAEQHRIVAKVDRLMGLCDQLEARLKERSALQERFVKSVVNGFVGKADQTELPL